MASTNELDAWTEDVPMADKGEPEFSAWLFNVPVVDDPADNSTIAGIGRRRAFIF